MELLLLLLLPTTDDDDLFGSVSLLLLRYVVTIRSTANPTANTQIMFPLVCQIEHRAAFSCDALQQHRFSLQYSL